MKFVTITEKEFTEFAKIHPQASYFQTVEIANLRSTYGSKIHYLGVKEKNKIIAASMFSETNTLFGKKTFYAPRGFLLDYHNKELLEFFTKELTTYAKKKNCMMIKIDPNVIYQVRDIDGKIKENETADDETINNLKDIGYRHYGFNTDIEFTQSRWNFRVALDVPYEELKQQFSKSTRKNIEATYKKGIQVRVGTKDDLESMEEILIKTAERKNFQYKTLDYYTRMYEKMGDLMRIYIAYVDPKQYISCSKELLKEAEEKYQEVQDKMKKDMIGEKLKKQEENSLKQIEKCKKDLEEAEAFAKENPKGKDIGVLISLKSGQEYLTLYSGYLVEYRKFTPKYAMYNEHILDAYRFKFPYVNFYGISGIFDPNDKNYGMYEFKRGFGGEVIEMIGEFTYPTSNLYYVYMALRKTKIGLKKIKAKLK